MREPTRQQSNTDSLREEWQASILPWSQTPFAHGLVTSEPEDEFEELKPGELRVKAPEEVPWIDLLLEIAMTTAFASLTDGTPILEIKAALGYVCYFFFVWWIWVAQVAYNMRFRQADVLHRIWVFAQLIIFSALAAFTGDFDITSGTSQDPDEALTDSLFAQSGAKDKKGLAAFHFRGSHLPLSNARGLSLTMALSRLLLLLQYVVVFYHAKRLSRASLLVHMIPLLFSSVCYLGAFIILSTGHDSGPSQAAENIKLVLWFLPIIVEIISHFVAQFLPGFVKYSTESVYARSGTVFLIILGAGLDKITSGFKLIVGNTGLGRDGISLFVSAAVIFIGFFSLYFGTPGSTRHLGHKRALAWLFSQFFFLAALIVALQGVATSLAFSNLNAALDRIAGATEPVFDWMKNNPQVNVTADNFNSSATVFSNLGLAFDDFVDDMNMLTNQSIQANDSTIITTGQFFEEVSYFSYILETFEAKPEPGSLLDAKLALFLDPDYIGNTTELNPDNYLDLYSEIIKARGSSALWFYPACGLTIIGLVLMSLIKGLPQDKWEWGIITNRFAIGSGLCLLATLNIGESKPMFNSEGNTDSIIWGLAAGDQHLLLIIMASIMALLLIIEKAIGYAANRRYNSFGSVNFLEGPERRRSQRQAKSEAQYQRTAATDGLTVQPHYDFKREDSGPTGLYDPYHEISETTLYK